MFNPDVFAGIAVWAVCTLVLIMSVTGLFKRAARQDDERLPPIPVPREVPMRQRESAAAHARERAIVERTNMLIYTWTKGGQHVPTDLLFTEIAREFATLELRLAELERVNREIDEL